MKVIVNEHKGAEEKPFPKLMKRDYDGLIVLAHGQGSGIIYGTVMVECQHHHNFKRLRANDHEL